MTRRIVFSFDPKKEKIGREQPFFAPKSARSPTPLTHFFFKKMDTAELIRRVRKIEIKTRGLTRHEFSGEYHSAFKGRGMSFAEARPYQWGDDVRHLDWNVSARTGEPHIKIFEEERELTVMLMVDVSQSAFWGAEGPEKREFLAEICAVLAFSALSNGDKVGLLLFSDRVELFMPPKKGRSHALRIIRELLNVEPKGRQTDIGGAIEWAQNFLKKRAICFLASDFLAPDFEAALKLLARKHDVIGLHAFDEKEKTLPDVGLALVEDPETGRRMWLDTSNEAVRARYSSFFKKNLAATEQAFFRSRADLLSLKTSEAYAAILRSFFAKRA